MSPPVSVGDYAANLGPTGVDLPTRLLPSSTALPDPTNNEILPDFRYPHGVFVVPNKSGDPKSALLRQDPLRLLDITDGLSNTLLVGEKHVPPDRIGTYPLDCGIYDGHNYVCSARGAGPAFPLAVHRYDPGWRFGSSHPGLCHFVFCDGSVRPLRTSIDSSTLGLLAQRDDGQVIPEY